jgi:hypothetical protein
MYDRNAVKKGWYAWLGVPWVGIVQANDIDNSECIASSGKTLA